MTSLLMQFLIRWRTVNYPVCVRCPKCGRRKHTTVKAEHPLPYMRDRVCSGCETRYIVPTPLAAVVAFFAMSLGAGALGLIFLCFAVYAIGRGNLCPMLVACLLGYVSVEFMMFAIRGYSEQVVLPPAEPPPGSESSDSFSPNAPPAEQSDNPYESPHF